MKSFVVRSLLAVLSLLNAITVVFMIITLATQEFLEDFIFFLDNEKDKCRPKPKPQSSTCRRSCGGVCFLLLILVLIAGCNRYTISISTSPAYGIIYANGERVGLSSVKLRYKIPEEAVYHDSICFPRFSSIWYSYASADTNLVLPKHQHRTKLVFRSDSTHRDIWNERSIRSGLIKHTVRR